MIGMIIRIKELILSLVDRNPFLRNLVCLHKQSQNKSFIEEINRRKELSIFDYKALSQELKEYPLFYISDCNYYGLYCSLLQYCGLKFEDLSLRQRHYFYIEHGLVLGRFVNTYNVKKAKAVTTFGRNRQQNINRAVPSAQSVGIGPYIHYCDSLLSDTILEDLKEQLGRVLLVIPSHSIASLKADFDEDLFLSSIKSKMADYDTILVCLYWKDIDNGADEFYLRQGFKVTTAGHRDDLNFLPRLKSLLLLATEVYSNSVGTHVPYCLTLNVPIKIFNQEINYQKIQDFQVNKLVLEDQTNVLSAAMEKTAILEALENNDLEALDHYFGLNSLKSPQEISNLIMALK